MANRERKASVKLLIVKGLLHLLAFSPFIYLLLAVRAGAFSADPAKDIQQFTGLTGLKLLTVTLLISPLSRWFHQPLLLRCRRLIGLWCFAWATLHLLSYYFLELGSGNLALLAQEIIRRPYLTLGMLSWVVLLLLAATSFYRIQRRMGKRWQQLHNCIYLPAILVPLHYLWSVKAWSLQPFIWLTLALLLCVLRSRKLLRKTHL
ncbi:sulfoxide reductase heme-binding subunit YedZ [Tatumella sp. JGM130]|uniref:protein-methionine-sulfoxide reductase heme-binding subunit MsrQ n=1 Tax=Tatumella sp. JGM130 TaxID=2799797 RepID=UPI001BAF45A6|nr:protein-methionine-sulfoxide reductase heme-binding subunit MsrQ [Tatumella sp. JGM130]MBS0893396.1 sulfoxide reductase heme-binding subunit YedZ [Tatumella sp. JGM130]